MSSKSSAISALINTETENLNYCRNWLKSAVSLVVIMGLTWIVGILIVEVEALLPLAYIYTIMVAFQGLFIFFIFVVFSKQVREAYSKWWKIKVNESDFLSKYFGKKTLTTATKSSKLKSGIRTESRQRESSLTSPPPLTREDLTLTTSYKLPTILITPLNVPDKQESAPRIPKTNHWSTLKRHVNGGMVFNIVYKPSLSEQPPDDGHGHENEDREIDDHFKGSMSSMVLLQDTCKPMITLSHDSHHIRLS